MRGRRSVVEQEDEKKRGGGRIMERGQRCGEKGEVEAGRKEGI